MEKAFEVIGIILLIILFVVATASDVFGEVLLFKTLMNFADM